MLVAEMTDNAAPRHSGQWKKGQSGNPAGMPKGTRHRATMLAEKFMEDDAEDIVRAVVNAAKAGDPTAMRLCIERLAPLRKGRPIEFDLPPVETASEETPPRRRRDSPKAHGSVRHGDDDHLIECTGYPSN
jgi:hypothetical protein